MAKQTISARFESLQQAERAATEVRSLLGTDIDIRTLSEHQSDHGERSSHVPGIFALPNLNLSASTPYAAIDPTGSFGLEDKGTYSKHAYVMEVMVEEESEHQNQITEVIARYDGELV